MIENLPAFPRPCSFRPDQSDCVDNGAEGMSLRDYLAAHSGITFEDAVRVEDVEKKETFRDVFTRLARMRYSYADAALEIRSKSV